MHILWYQAGYRWWYFKLLKEPMSRVFNMKKILEAKQHKTYGSGLYKVILLEKTGPTFSRFSLVLWKKKDSQIQIMVCLPYEKIARSLCSCVLREFWLKAVVLETGNITVVKQEFNSFVFFRERSFIFSSLITFSFLLPSHLSVRQFYFIFFSSCPVLPIILNYCL